jgi:hypothetical protein
MAIKPALIKPRATSVTFRRFNRRHASLSSHYWSHVLGTESVKKALKGAPPNDLTVIALGLPMKQQEYGFNVTSTLDSIDDYLNTARLHILAICLAQLGGKSHRETGCTGSAFSPLQRNHEDADLQVQLSSGFLSCYLRKNLKSGAHMGGLDGNQVELCKLRALTHDSVTEGEN